MTWGENTLSSLQLYIYAVAATFGVSNQGSATASHLHDLFGTVFMTDVLRDAIHTFLNLGMGATVAEYWATGRESNPETCINASRKLHTVYSNLKKKRKLQLSENLAINL